MKRYINILLPVLMFISFACAYKVQNDKMYTPPSVKVQPRFYYPRLAQENLQSGTTKVILNISKLGIVDKVDLKESSGFKVLDQSAIEYCKSLTFNPAKVDNEPINSRIEWELKFNFSDKSWRTNDYVETINEFLIKIKTVGEKERADIEKQILELHTEYIQNMTDIVNFNSVTEKVIASELSKDWKTIWNAYPLSFLLYHDFIKRFPDYSDLENVKLLLKASVKSDIQYIKDSPFVDMRGQGEKEQVLMKIRQFMKINYPDVMLDDVGFAQNTGKNIS